MNGPFRIRCYRGSGLADGGPGRRIYGPIFDQRSLLDRAGLFVEYKLEKGVSEPIEWVGGAAGEWQ